MKAKLRQSFIFGFIAIGLIVSVGPSTLQGEPPESADRRVGFECRWCDESLTMDGQAKEPAWAGADVIDDFYLPWLADAPSAQAKTRARLLWDREQLYFFAELDDADLFADVTEHDGKTWSNDVFELFFKPADDKPGYYEFQVNAAGTRMDMFLPSRGAGGYEKFVSKGEFDFEAKVELRGTLNRHTDRDMGWSIEGRIPWTDLLRTGGRPNPGETWRFALCRYDYSGDRDKPELSTCAPLNQKSIADFHAADGYASLTFVGGDSNTARPSFGIESYFPLTTSRVIGSPDPPSPYRIQRAFPDLRLSWPIFVLAEPGSSRLLVIDQKSSYGKARLTRTGDSLESGQLETLIEWDGVAYSVVCHPHFEQNGYVYVGWNGPASDGGKRKFSKVTRYTLDRQPPFGLDPKSEQLIIEWESDGHNGAAVTFGLDGKLYVTSGDGTSDSDTNIKGQGLDHLLSKLLRIDVDHPSDGRMYSVPDENPFVGHVGARPETWAYGFRNPWRITTDERTGHIWVGNNGQDLWEQAFLVERGANYGWSVYEGGHVFYAGRQLGPTPHILPTVEHPHSEFRSLTGGVVYYGKKHPELAGTYIYGDYSTGKVWGIKVDQQRQILWHKELVDTTLQISAFAIDHSGELLILDHRANPDGGLYSLEVNPADNDAASRFPKKLSETGLFASVKDHRVQSGIIPYDVNSPLWSDGAIKERFMALPGEHPEIEVTATRGWNFPNQTVLIKSFALEQRQGDPASRRWIETRLLTKQEGEWFGYSYRWNDEQTDAELVPREGADQMFSISTPNGMREQKWEYPSRTQCMVCHSRAANYVLGTTTLQLNRAHDYGGMVDNQLRVLENLGVLRVDWRTPATAALRRELEAKGMSEKQIYDAIAERTSSSGQRAAVPSTLLATAPEKMERLVDPYDAMQCLDLRARSYLQANCAHCHVEAGGGNAQIDLEFATDSKKRNLFDARPLHHTFGIPDARLVAPGDPARSVLLYRLEHRGTGQMPQLATSLVDDAAVEMLRQWILQMK